MQAVGTLLVFVSMFASGEKGGIRAFLLDPATGSLAPAAATPGIRHPFFMAVVPGAGGTAEGGRLYAVDAVKFGGPAPGEIVAFRIADRDGRLEEIGRQSSRGTATCFIDAAGGGRSLLLANYSSRSVAALPIRADGVPGTATSFFEHVGAGADPARQKEPHPHAIIHGPGDRFAYAADLGTDQIVCYQLDASRGVLRPADPPFAKTPAGAGPRHLAFHPDGRRLYCINELSNSVTVFDHDAATGRLEPGPTVSTLPDDFAGKSNCADLKLTPDGRFLYGTNRGHDSIAIFRVGDDGRLARIGIVPSRGTGPQNLAITPDGSTLLCANMPGGNVSIFRIDPAGGTLEPVGEPVAVGSPACIRLLPRSCADLEIQHTIDR